MNYLLIKNGLIVTGNKVFKADLLIGNSTIIEIASNMVRPDPMTPVIDAGGRFVIPGAIDYCHYDITGKQVNIHERDKLISNQVVNGTTTLFETQEPEKSEELADFIEELNVHQQVSMPDFAFHFSPAHYRFMNERDLLDSYVHFGMSSIYVSTAYNCYRHDSLFKKLYAFAERFNLTVIIELPDLEEVDWNNHLQNYSANDGNQIQPIYLEKVLMRMRHATFPVLISRLRYAEEVAMFQKFVAENKNLYAEIEMPCVLGESSINISDLSLKTNDMSLINHDQFCKLICLDNYLVARPSLKLMIGNSAESPVFNRPDKYFALKYYTSMLYTLTVVSGKLAITDFVNAIASKPSKLMGLFPQKGVIRVGGDADIVIWNPDVERNIYCFVESESPVMDQKLHGKTEFVFSKGKMVYEGETFYNDNLKGHYLYRSSVS